MKDTALPRTFRPEYGRVVSRILPAIVALMSACGLVFLWTTPRSGLWLALASFGVAFAFLLLYFWFLIYREIEFGRERIVVRRYLFPDLEAGYRSVTGVSPTGFRLDGFPVACHTMENAGELRAILEDLRERGKIELAEDGGLTRGFRENLAATVKAAFLGVALWAGVEALELTPAGWPDDLVAYGVIFATLMVGAPLIKRLSSG